MIKLNSHNRFSLYALVIGLVACSFLIGIISVNSTLAQNLTNSLTKKYNQGRALFHREKYSKAKSLFLNLLGQSPSQEMKRKINYYLGRILRKQKKQPVQALKHFQEVYTSDKKDNLTDDSLFFTADILKNQLDQPQMAIPYLKTIKKEFSNSDYREETVEQLNTFSKKQLKQKKSFPKNNIPPPKIVFNFKQVRLKDFISTYSELTGKNFLYSSRVDGTVTLVGGEGIPISKLHEVFVKVLETRGYTITKKGDIYHVQQVQEALESGVDMKVSKTGLESQFFSLGNLPWKEVTSALDVILPRNKNLIRLKELNQILITSRPEKLKEVTRLLANMRRMHKQNQIKTTIVEYTPEYTSLKNLSNKLQSLLSRYLSKDQFKLLTNQSSSTLLALVPMDRKQQTLDLIDQIDKDVDKKLIKKLKVRVFRLQNAKVNKVKQKITELLQVLPGEFLSKNLKIVADQRQKAIIVSTTSETAINIIENTISELDQKSPTAPSNVRVFQMNHADEEEVANTLKEMKNVLPGHYQKGDIKIIPHERRRAIVVAAESKKVFKIIGDIVNQIDKKDVQQPMTHHVYQLENAQAGPLAEKLSSLFESQKKGGDERPLNVTADEQSNSLIVSASPQDWGIIKRMLNVLDDPKKQILVDVYIVEATDEKLYQLGVEWNAQGSITIGNTSRDITAGPSFGKRPAQGSQTTGSGNSAGNGSLLTGPLTNQGGLEIGLLTPSGNNLQALLQAFSQDRDFTLLSTSHLMANENEEASISVGQKVPFIQKEQTSQEGQATTQNFEFKDVGIELSITPTLSSDSEVTLDIKQQVSRIQQGNLTSGRSIRFSRDIQTTVSIPNGMTLVLGGIMRTGRTNTINKVPYLGDIPYLKHLFRSKTDDTTKRNLLLFLRPHILNTEEQLKQKTRSLERLRKKRSGNKKGLKNLQKNNQSNSTTNPPLR